MLSRIPTFEETCLEHNTIENEIEKLADLIPKLSEKDRDFATSLITQGRMRPLKPLQKEWVIRLLRRARNAAPVPISVDLRPIVTLLETASEHLKRPRLRIKAGAVSLELRVAGSTARYPGSLNILGTQRDVYTDRAPWYGRIHTTGRHEPARDIDDATAILVAGALLDLAKDPAAAAAAYGKLTSTCCMCGITLSDPRSIAVGYGPTCAQNWGLPWGE